VKCWIIHALLCCTLAAPRAGAGVVVVIRIFGHCRIVEDFGRFPMLGKLGWAVHERVIDR